MSHFGDLPSSLLLFSMTCLDPAQVALLAQASSRARRLYGDLAVRAPSYWRRVCERRGFSLDPSVDAGSFKNAYIRSVNPWYCSRTRPRPKLVGVIPYLGRIILFGAHGGGKTTMMNILMLPGSTAAAGWPPRLPRSALREQDVLIAGRCDVTIVDVAPYFNFPGYLGPLLDKAHILAYCFDAMTLLASKGCCLERMQRHIEKALEVCQPARIVIFVSRFDLLPQDIEDAQRDELCNVCVEAALVVCKGAPVECSRTSIWDDSFYAAWSTLAASLVPWRKQLRALLEHIREVCEADEVLLLDAASLLPLCSSVTREAKPWLSDIHRVERVSTILKGWRTCMAKSSPSVRFSNVALEMSTSLFSIAMQRFTGCSLLFVVAPPRRGQACVKLNLSIAMRRVPSTCL